MGFTTTLYKYHNGSPDRKPAYRGVVREYTGSPKVIVHLCDEVRYSRVQAEKDAKKLKEKLVKERHG